MSKDVLLQLKDLTIDYNNDVIVRDISMTLKNNEVHCIVSKDLLKLNSILSVIQGDENYNIKSGNIYLNENNINGLNERQRLKHGIFHYKNSYKTLKGETISEIIKNNLDILKDESMTLLSFKMNVLEYINDLNITIDDFKKTIDKDDDTSLLTIKSHILLMLILRPKLILVDYFNTNLIESISTFLLNEKSSILCIANDKENILKYNVSKID